MHRSEHPEQASRGAEIAHFHALTAEQQHDAMRRLAAIGMSDHGIAAATRFAVEQVRQILGERRAVG